MGTVGEKAKVSLEVREVRNASDEDVNDPTSKDFIRFMSAKQGNDGTTIYVHDHTLRKTKVNETRSVEFLLFYKQFVLIQNCYEKLNGPKLTRFIAPIVRKHEILPFNYSARKAAICDFSLVELCKQIFAEIVILFFFTAASWFWDNHVEHLDLFDCRNTQWYINAATNSKNVVIMLDMSGSMLGQ
ncbi:unnamed protein product, partial [Strongylus vulgaris]